MSTIHTREYRHLRADLKEQWRTTNTPCALCGQATIDWDAPANEPDSFELDHKISRKARPDLAMNPTNMQPSHHRCNRSKGEGPALPGIGETTEDW